MGHESKCAHLHGHNYVVYFTAAAEMNTLDTIGRVIDFSVLKQRIGTWLDDHWDHGFILHREDDAGMEAMKCFEKLSEQKHQKIFHMPYNPTAENMALFLGDVVCPAALEGTGVRIIRVKVEETENCAAVWIDETD